MQSDALNSLNSACLGNTTNFECAGAGKAWGTAQGDTPIAINLDGRPRGKWKNAAATARMYASSCADSAASLNQVLSRFTLGAPGTTDLFRCADLGANHSTPQPVLTCTPAAVGILSRAVTMFQGGREFANCTQTTPTTTPTSTRTTTPTTTATTTPRHSAAGVVMQVQCADLAAPVFKDLYETTLQAAVSAACQAQSSTGNGDGDGAACPVQQVRTECRGVDTAASFFEVYAPGAALAIDLSNLTVVVPLQSRYSWLEDEVATALKAFPGYELEVHFAATPRLAKDLASHAAVVAGVRTYLGGVIAAMPADADASGYPVLLGEGGRLVFPGTAARARTARSGAAANGTASIPAVLHYAVEANGLAEFWALHATEAELQAQAQAGNLSVEVAAELAGALHPVTVRISRVGRAGTTGTTTAAPAPAGPGTTAPPVDGQNKGSNTTTSTSTIITIAVIVIAVLVLALVVGLVYHGQREARKPMKLVPDGSLPLPLPRPLADDEYLDVNTQDRAAMAGHYYPSTRVRVHGGKGKGKGGSGSVADAWTDQHSNDDWSVWGFDAHATKSRMPTLPAGQPHVHGVGHGRVQAAPTGHANAGRPTWSEQAIQIEAATTIQAAFRGQQVRRSNADQAAAATKIQAAFRGQQVRKSLPGTSPHGEEGNDNEWMQTTAALAGASVTSPKAAAETGASY